MDKMVVRRGAVSAVSLSFSKHRGTSSPFPRYRGSNKHPDRSRISKHGKTYTDIPRFPSTVHPRLRATMSDILPFRYATSRTMPESQSQGSHYLRIFAGPSLCLLLAYQSPFLRRQVDFSSFMLCHQGHFPSSSFTYALAEIPPKLSHSAISTLFQ